MFDVVERLKKDWTDKYVVVDSPAPELSRFAQATGIVKTVNMNGRCLVEFDQYNNIGWYDIDPSALKVVPKPLPKPPEAKEKPAAKAAAPAAKPAAAKPAAAKPSAAKPATGAKPAGGRPSTADILAMARAKNAGAAPAPAAKEPASEPEPVANEPEAEAVPVAPSAPPKKASGGPAPTTTAEKIAWCRANDSKG
jgi:hypothetical protein